MQQLFLVFYKKITFLFKIMLDRAALVMLQYAHGKEKEAERTPNIIAYIEQKTVIAAGGF